MTIATKTEENNFCNIRNLGGHVFVWPRVALAIANMSGRTGLVASGLPPEAIYLASICSLRWTCLFRNAFCEKEIEKRSTVSKLWTLAQATGIGMASLFLSYLTSRDFSLSKALVAFSGPAFAYMNAQGAPGLRSECNTFTMQALSCAAAGGLGIGAFDNQFVGPAITGGSFYIGQSLKEIALKK